MIWCDLIPEVAKYGIIKDKQEGNSGPGSLTCMCTSHISLSDPKRDPFLAPGPLFEQTW